MFALHGAGRSAAAESGEAGFGRKQFVRNLNRATETHETGQRAASAFLTVPNPNMMKHRKKTLLACAVCAAALALNAELGAADSTLNAAPVKADIAPAGYKGPIEYEGKIMVINRAEQTVTIEINGKLHLFKVNPQVRVLRKGKPVSIQDIIPGQRISLVARTLDDGSLQLLSLGLDPNAVTAEPAGAAKSAKPDRQVGHPKTGSTVPIENKPGQGPKNAVPPPFQGGYFPGHVEKVVVSPNN